MPKDTNFYAHTRYLIHQIYYYTKSTTTSRTVQTDILRKHPNSICCSHVSLCRLSTFTCFSLLTWFSFFLSLLCLLINCNFSNTMFNFRFLVVFKNLRVLRVFPLLHFTILVPLFSYANSIVCTSSCCFPVYFFFLFWVNLWVFASDLNQDLMICECGCVRSVCYGLVHALNRQKGVYPLNKWL